MESRRSRIFAPKMHIFMLALVLGSPPLPVSAAARYPAPAPCKPALPHEHALSIDSPPPDSGDRGYDVLSYDLDLIIDPASLTIQGTNAIGLKALAAGLDSVVLDLVPELSCDLVLAGRDTLGFDRAGEELIVRLGRPLAVAGAETLIVRYGGRPPRHGSFNAGLMFREHNAGTPDDRGDDVPIVANLSQPWSAHAWWPCKDHPADKARVSLAATVPDTLSAVSNGRLLGVEEPAPGLRRFRWREDYPLSTYLVSVAVSDYVGWSEDCFPAVGGPIRLDFHVFPADRAVAEIEFAPTCAMVDFMTRLAGPYPFAGEKYAQVEFKWIGAMEHQTATSYSQLLLTGDRRYETTVVHELAHQWFGDSLTPSSWSEIWLNEGFARYVEALWVEHSRGADSFREFMLDTGPRRHPDLFRGEGLLADPNPILPNLLVYDKGAWVLHMLRQTIGDVSFFAFLADYAGQPNLALGTVSLEEMIASAEAAADRDLGGFFTPWLETDETPVIGVGLSPGGSGSGVRVLVRQFQDPVFEVPVPLVLHTGCGDLRATVPLAQRAQVFPLATPCAVDSLSIDPSGLSLLRAAGAARPLLEVIGPTPNPAGAAGADFDLYVANDAEVTVKLYDARGSLIIESVLGLVSATGAADNPLAVPYAWRWRPDGGRDRPASGVYWLEFRGAGGRAVKKLVYVR